MAEFIFIIFSRNDFLSICSYNYKYFYLLQGDGYNTRKVVTYNTLGSFFFQKSSKVKFRSGCLLYLKVS